MFYNDAYPTLSLGKIHDLLNNILWDSKTEQIIPDDTFTREELEECFIANIEKRFGNYIVPMDACPDDPAAYRRLVRFYRSRAFDEVLSALEREGAIRIEATGEIVDTGRFTTREQYEGTAPDRASFAVTLAEFRQLAGMPWGYVGAPLYKGHRSCNGAPFLIRAANDDVYAPAVAS